MHFALKAENFTVEAASLWADLLGIDDRLATFEEAKSAFDQNDFGGSFDDYFDGTGAYKGPCALGISVEDRDR